MSEPVSAATYQLLTSYEPGREWDHPVADPLVLQDFTPMDPDRLPPSVKSYPPGLPTSPLPRDLASIPVSATEALAGRASPLAAGRAPRPSMTELATVLFLAAGVVRTMERNGRELLFRAAGSAGGRFPLEVYVVTCGVEGIADGVHWYDPVEHALVQVGPPAGGTATTVVVTGVPWRTGWKYAERGFRHLYWDAGTMLSQLLVVAGALGLDTRLVTAFPDAEVAATVGADGVHEFPLACVVIGPGEPALASGGPAVSGRLDADPVEFPLVTGIQHSGDCRELGPAWLQGTAVPEAPSSAPLGEVILRRGSTRLMRRDASVPRAQLEFAMSVATRGISAPQFVAVHAVDGVAPGLYRWPDLQTPVRSADLRDEVARICLDQALGGDAAYVVFSCADAAGLDAHGLREALLAAGLVEGRLHLAAFALCTGASGMTFLDSEIAGFLGEPLAAMLLTCVGVPAYRNRQGGRPGAPATFRPVAPR